MCVPVPRSACHFPGLCFAALDIYDDLPSGLRLKPLRVTLQDVADGVEEVNTLADRAALHLAQEKHYRSTSAQHKQHEELLSTSSDTEKEINELNQAFKECELYLTILRTVSTIRTRVFPWRKTKTKLLSNNSRPGRANRCLLAPTAQPLVSTDQQALSRLEIVKGGKPRRLAIYAHLQIASPQGHLLPALPRHIPTSDEHIQLPPPLSPGSRYPATFTKEARSRSPAFEKRPRGEHCHSP